MLAPIVLRYPRPMLELDHVIRFVPSPDVDLAGFTIEPGRVHTGQGTRNLRIVFDRNYLELAWVEHPEEVAARGLDFVARCARPTTASPFGCVLRGALPPALRPHFAPYPLPDAPGVVLQLLSPQPLEAPFVAVFDTGTPGGSRPAHAVAPAHLRHDNGATHIVRATFTAPVAFALAGPLAALVPELRFATGAPRLELDLGALTVSYTA